MRIPEEGITWHYTTWLNITFLLLAATLLVRSCALAALRCCG
ncbi:hypothetical protein QFZ22_003611 [Streptomyces canus]|uniref:Uncharacterized protein n=1 Tax=Streptomyces canus TaxID=58343 RepID=A0AAW8FBX7_9ACTN|nr:hypothetical protein [Streptomyces canus]